MSRERLRMVGAVVLAAGALLLAAPVTAQSGSPSASPPSMDPSMDPSLGPSGSASPIPGPSVALDDATRRLLGYVPEGMRAACHPSVSPMTDGPAVECVDGGATVSHTLFEDVASRDATFTMAQSAIDAVASADSCAAGPYSGPYALGPNGAGDILCLSDGTQVVFLWARDGVPVLSFAVTDTLDQAGMFEWWLSAGPNPGSETD
jgi:hypothetical protein